MKKLTFTPPAGTRDQTSRRSAYFVAALLISCSLTGCTSFLGSHRIAGIPVSRVPRQLLDAERKNNYEDTSLIRLRQDPPPFYALGPGDVLGIEIPGITSVDPAVADLAGATSLSVPLPAVHFHENSDLPPAVGLPIPVRDDGTLVLPYVGPVSVEGKSLIQATKVVQDAYYGGPDPFLKLEEGEVPEGKVSLTMIHRRTVRVLVMREESGGIAEVTKRGSGTVVDLPAYENDVLHALTETGGLPGLDAKNEVIVLRGMYEDGITYEQVMNHACLDCMNCEDPCFCDERPMPDPPNMTRIPLRYDPRNPPNFGKDDILLSEGDIVMIKSRDRETFFTGGILGGQEIPLPRDHDLDVVGAVALAGGQLGQGATAISAISGGGGRGGFGGGGGQFGGAGGGAGASGFCQPSEVLVIRDLPCGNQITLKVDLNRALTNRSERILIKPGDMVMLRYTLAEEAGNLVLGLLPAYLIGNGLNN
ncbi:MAG: polysaccharide biosynthesis/export family protein [Planctomycetaceae bacterium]|nr:polysaccharide biosynthesis/export family protein [Planctomycetaceae bacterium]